MRSVLLVYDSLRVCPPTGSQLQIERCYGICVFFCVYLKQTVSANILASVFVVRTFLGITHRRDKMHADEIIC